MFFVVLVGADGAGKSTLLERLPDVLPAPVRTLYMGVRLESSERLLPSSRLILRLKRRFGWTGNGGPPELERRRPVSRGWKAWPAAGYRVLRVSNLIAEQYYRLAVASYHHWRGRIVVFDRDFWVDHYRHGVLDSSGRTASERFYLWTVRRCYPRPSLLIVLDAPARVLLERKGEGTLEALQSRRREYLEVARVVPDAVVVDASRPLEAVLEEVAGWIRRRHPACRGAAGDGTGRVS